MSLILFRTANHTCTRLSNWYAILTFFIVPLALVILQIVILSTEKIDDENRFSMALIQVDL